MTITAARLRPYNKRNGQPKRSHTTASGVVYKAGTQDVPSPLRIVESRADLRELEQLPEFQILTFADRAELDRYLEQEMYSRVRLGAAPQMAVVQGPGGDSHVAPMSQASSLPRPGAVAPAPLTEAPRTVTPADMDEGLDADEPELSPVPPQVAALVAPTPVGAGDDSALPGAPIAATTAAPPTGRIKAGRKPGKK